MNLNVPNNSNPLRWLLASLVIGHWSLVIGHWSLVIGLMIAAVAAYGYVPLKLFSPESNQEGPPSYDRLRFRLESLGKVQDSQSIIEKVIERRHPKQNIRAR
jgi:hypothetical protein